MQVAKSLRVDQILIIGNNLEWAFIVTLTLSYLFCTQAKLGSVLLTKWIYGNLKKTNVI